MFMHLCMFVVFSLQGPVELRTVLLCALIPNQQRWIHGRANITSHLGKVSIKVSRNRTIKVAESWIECSSQCASHPWKQEPEGQRCLSLDAPYVSSVGKEWTFCASQLLQGDLWPCRRLWAETPQGMVMKVPPPWIHVTRTQLFLLISVMFALWHWQYVFVGLPSCKMKRFSGIFKFLHWKDGQALASSGCLRKRGNHCLWMCS